MPAPAVDAATKEAVKAMAVRDGITIAAESFGISVGTVKAWSAREKWLQPALQPVVQPLPLSLQPKHAATVATPSQAARTAKQLQDERAHTYGRTYVRKALRDAARLKPGHLLAEAPNVKAVVGSGTGLNMSGFERQPDRTATGLVNIAIIGVPPEQIEVQSSTSSSTEQA